MLNTDTLWFDLAIVMSIFAIGNILFGHFEEHKAKWRRLLKVGVVMGITLGLSYFGLRWLAYALLGMMGLAAAYIHIWWLPSQGINGWTGEPREKYYQLLGVRQGDSKRGE